MYCGVSFDQRKYTIQLKNIHNILIHVYVNSKRLLVGLHNFCKNCMCDLSLTLCTISHRMRGGQSKTFYTPVQRLDMPPRPKRKGVWKKFRQLLTPTWVTKKTNDTRAKRDQPLPPIPQPDNSRQLLNTPCNDIQREPSLISFSSIRPATPTSLYNLEELEELEEEFLAGSNPVSNLDEFATSMPSSNCLEEDLPPNQLQHAKSGETLVPLPQLQKGEASAHKKSTFQHPGNPTALEEEDAKDAGRAVVVERSSAAASTIPVLPNVPLPRPVKPSTINLRSQLPPIGSKAQQLTTRPVTARTCSRSVQPCAWESPDWERMDSDDDLLNMYREDLEKQELEMELEELKKTHGHLSVPRLRRYLRKRRKRMRFRKEEEQVKKVSKITLSNYSNSKIFLS